MHIHVNYNIPNTRIIKTKNFDAKLSEIFRSIRSGFFFGFAAIYSIFTKTKRNKEIIACAPSYLNGNILPVYNYLKIDKRFERAEIFFVVDNNEDVIRLQREGIDAVYARDFTQIPRFFRTGVWITDHGPSNIPLYWLYCYGVLSIQKIKGNALWVDTWHGIGFKGHSQSEYGDRMFMYDVQFVTSEWFKNIYISNFGFKKEQIYITGYPRNDLLVSANSRENVSLNEIIPKERFVILYAPTWENISKFEDLFPWELLISLDQIDSLCHKYHAEFYIRPHPISNIKLECYTVLDEYKHIKMADVRKFPDTQKLLVSAEILVTDWSSICFDYLLTEKPMVFINSPQPREKFTLGPDDRPGVIVNTLDEFIEVLSEVLNNPHQYHEKMQEKLERILKKCYKYRDNNSTKRCADVIFSKLN